MREHAAHMFLSHNMDEQNAELEDKLLEALQSIRCNLGEDHIHGSFVCSILGLVQAFRERIPEATSSISRACGLFEKRYDARHHFLVGEIYCVWADLLEAQGQAQEAKPMLGKVAIFEGSYGPDHIHSRRLRPRCCVRLLKAPLDPVRLRYHSGHWF